MTKKLWGQVHSWLKFFCGKSLEQALIWWAPNNGLTIGEAFNHNSLRCQIPSAAKAVPMTPGIRRLPCVTNRYCGCCPNYDREKLTSFKFNVPLSPNRKPYGVWWFWMHELVKSKFSSTTANIWPKLTKSFIYSDRVCEHAYTPPFLALFHSMFWTTNTYMHMCTCS